MIRILQEAVADYGRNAFMSNATSPLDLFNLKKPKYFIQLQDYYLPYLF